jgi:IS5 family transposase
MVKDAGYQGAENREELTDVKAEWAIAMRPGKLKELRKHPRKNKGVIAFERLKSSVRAKVELNRPGFSRHSVVEH